MHAVTESEVDAYAEAGVDQLVLYAPIRSTGEAEPVLDRLAGFIAAAG